MARVYERKDCPVCGKSVPVRLDGGIVRHRPAGYRYDRDFHKGRCPGGDIADNLKYRTSYRPAFIH